MSLGYCDNTNVCSAGARKVCLNYFDGDMFLEVQHDNMSKVIKYDVYLDVLLMMSVHVIQSLFLSEHLNPKISQIDCKVARWGSNPMMRPPMIRSNICTPTPTHPPPKSNTT